MYLGFWRPVALKPAPLLGVGRKCALELSNSGGVLLYGVARPSMQAEAPRISTLTVDELEAIAERARKKGLTVRVSP